MATTQGDLNITGHNFGIFTALKSLHVEQGGTQDNHLHINAFGEHAGVKVNQNQPKPFDVNKGQLRVTADGNVGIGTDAPQKRLHVKGNADVLALEGSNHAYIEWYPDGYTAGRKAWLGFGNTNDNNLTICNQIAGADIVLSPASGNVVVGARFGAAISGCDRGVGVFGSNLAVRKKSDQSGSEFYTPYDHNNRYGFAGMSASWGTLSFYTSSGNTTAGQVINVKPRLTIDSSGNVAVCNAAGQRTIQLDAQAGDIILHNADFAEDFDIAVAEAVEPGMVMVLDDSGALCASSTAYDRRVAGVVSGAGEHKPGIILDKQPERDSRLPVALVGKVFCKVDATYGPIAVGDLLTTSPTPGHAMKAGDPSQAFGAVLGKALRSLPDGTGLIPVLVALQ